MVDCKKTKLRFRADQVFWAALHSETGGEAVCYVSVIESGEMLNEATKAAHKKAKTMGKKGPFKPLDLKDLTEAPKGIYALIPSPASGEAGDLTHPRDFNLMFQTSVGAIADASAVAYLRPETAQVRNTYEVIIYWIENEVIIYYVFLHPIFIFAYYLIQGIFTNFGHVQRSARMKVSTHIFERFVFFSAINAGGDSS